MNKKIIEKFEKIRIAEVENFNKIGHGNFNVFVVEEKPDGEIITAVLLVPKGNEDFLNNRFDYLYKIGKIMKNEKEINIIAIISISEAWVSHVDKDDVKEYDKKIGMPRNDPKKNEILMFSIMDNNDETFMSMHQIKDENGKRSVEVEPMKGKHTKLQNELLGSFWKGHKGYVKV